MCMVVCFTGRPTSIFYTTPPPDLYIPGSVVYQRMHEIYTQHISLLIFLYHITFDKIHFPPKNRVTCFNLILSLLLVLVSVLNWENWQRERVYVSVLNEIETKSHSHRPLSVSIQSHIETHAHHTNSNCTNTCGFHTPLFISLSQIKCMHNAILCIIIHIILYCTV